MSPILYWFLLLPVIVVAQRGADLGGPGLAVLGVVWLAGHLALYRPSAGSSGSSPRPQSYEQWRAAVFSSSSEMGWNGGLFLVTLLAVFLAVTFLVVPHLGLDTDEIGEFVGVIPGAAAAALASWLLGPLFHRLRKP